MELSETSRKEVDIHYLLCLSIISNQNQDDKLLFDHSSKNIKERSVLVKANSNLMSLHQELFVFPGLSAFQNANSPQSIAKIQKHHG